MDLGLGRKSAPAERAAKALEQKITVHRRVQELAVARVKRGAATPETALASNYRLRRAAVLETLFLTKAKGSVEVPIVKAVLGLDGLSVPCSSCDERNTSSRLAGVGDLVLGPSPKLPTIWKSPPPKAKAPAVQPEEPSKPKAKKPKEEPPKKEKEEPRKKGKEEPQKKEKEELQKKKVKNEPKEETRVILKEAPAVPKVVLVPKPKYPPKKPPPPPPSPTLSEASVHFHDRAEPDLGSYTYYTEEEESKSD